MHVLVRVSFGSGMAWQPRACYPRGARQKFHQQTVGNVLLLYKHLSPKPRKILKSENNLGEFQTLYFLNSWRWNLTRNTCLYSSILCREHSGRLFRAEVNDVKDVCYVVYPNNIWPCRVGQWDMPHNSYEGAVVLMVEIYKTVVSVRGPISVLVVTEFDEKRCQDRTALVI